jgi:hypothetical protein
VGGVILKAIWTMRHASFTSGKVMNKFGLSLLDHKNNIFYFLAIFSLLNYPWSAKPFDLRTT